MIMIIHKIIWMEWKNREKNVQYEKNETQKPDEKYDDLISKWYSHLLHIYFSFRFISPFRAQIFALGLSHILISKWMLRFNFSLHVARCLLFLFFSLLLQCYPFCVWLMVSVDYLSVQKGNINYIASVFFFLLSCSSCATENTLHFNVHSTY